MFNSLNKERIINILGSEDTGLINELYSYADKVRKENVGNIIPLRGIIEFSNYCRWDCTYCGIRNSNSNVHRYRMELDEILKTAQNAYAFGYKTIVLQAGEDFKYSCDDICNLIKNIKATTEMCITLSIGERPFDEIKKFKDAGADRYLLKQETINPELYSKMHPNMDLSNRIDTLKYIKSLGLATGSGIMIGLPGQTFEMIADDLLMFRELQIDMAGIGPYLPHPETPLGKEYLSSELSKTGKIKNIPVEEVVYRALAIARILNPKAHLPATTALATVNKEKGRVNAFNVGANVVMLNVTEPKYKQFYEIYPQKICNAKEEPISLDDLNEKIKIPGRSFL